MITAITLATVYDAQPYMGPAYWIPAFWVPALLVTHYLVLSFFDDTGKERPSMALQPTRLKRASLLNCVGEPLNRSVRRFLCTSNS